MGKESTAACGQNPFLRINFSLQNNFKSGWCFSFCKPKMIRFSTCHHPYWCANRTTYLSPPLLITNTEVTLWCVGILCRHLKEQETIVENLKIQELLEFFPCRKHKLEEFMWDRKRCQGHCELWTSSFQLISTQNGGSAEMRCHLETQIGLLLNYTHICVWGFYATQWK